MKKVLLALMVAAGVILSANEKEVNLGTVLVTEERFESETAESTRPVIVISAEEIEKQGAATVMDVLKNYPGLSVKDYTGAGKTGSVDIHGQGATAVSNVLIMVNGIRNNPIDMSVAELSGIKTEQIERIEILTAGSVLYGDNASAGVINIITKKGSGKGFEGRINGEAGSYGLLKYNARAGFSNEKFGVYADYSKLKTDGYRENSYFNNQNIIAGANGKLGDILYGNVEYSSYDDKYGMPGSLSAKDTEENRTKTDSPNDYATTKESNATANIGTKLGKLNLEVALAYKDRATYYLWGKYFSDGKIKQTAIMPKLKYEYEIAGNTGEIVSGYDYIRGNVDSTNPYGKSELEKISNGYYLANKVFINDIILSQGYRTENSKYTSGNFTNDAYELGVAAKYGRTGKIYANYSKTYRNPNTDEIAGSTNIIIPQKGNTIAVGVKDTIAGMIVYDIYGYKTNTTDEIYYNPAVVYDDLYKSWIGNNENLKGETQRTGLNASFTEYLSGLELGQQITLIDPVINNITVGGTEYKNKKIPGVSSFGIKTYASLNLLDSLNLFVKYSYNGEQYAGTDWANTQEKAKAYQVVDTTASFTFEGIKIYGGVNNLLNEKYSEFVLYSDFKKGMFYYPSPERNFFAGIKYTF